MIGLLQRVTEGWVSVDGHEIARIGPGLVVLAAVERSDGEAQVRRMAERLVAYRVFPDADGRMNLSVRDTRGAILLVPQFTLAADTDRGNRPSLGRAAAPADGARLFDSLVGEVRRRHPDVATGRFGANMQVGLVNDGPVTFWIRVAAPA